MSCSRLPQVILHVYCMYMICMYMIIYVYDRCGSWASETHIPLTLLCTYHLSGQLIHLAWQGLQKKKNKPTMEKRSQTVISFAIFPSPSLREENLLLLGGGVDSHSTAQRIFLALCLGISHSWQYWGYHRWYWGLKCDCLLDYVSCPRAGKFPMGTT